MKNTIILAGFMAMALYACNSQEGTKTALTQSGLDPQKFETNVDGQQTHLYTLTNKNGVYTEDLLDNVTLGKEYFESSTKNIELVVFTQDQPKMLNLVNREHLLEELSEKPVLSEDYRLVIHGKPIWYHMKIVRAGDWSKERRMLVGVFNNERLKQQEAEHKTFSEMTNILCDSYESIYYVDMADDSYFMFNNHGGIMEREMELRGRNFFAEAQKRVKTVIHPDDVAMVANFIDRAHIVTSCQFIGFVYIFLYFKRFDFVVYLIISLRRGRV